MLVLLPFVTSSLLFNTSWSFFNREWEACYLSVESRTAPVLFNAQCSITREGYIKNIIREYIQLFACSFICIMKPVIISYCGVKPPTGYSWARNVLFSQEKKQLFILKIRTFNTFTRVEHVLSENEHPVHIMICWYHPNKICHSITWDEGRSSLGDLLKSIHSSF